MSHKILTETILEESDFLICVMKADTFDIIYLNKAGKKIADVSQNNGAVCAKSYCDVICGYDNLVHICNENTIDTERFFCWGYYNALLKEHFRNQIKRLNFDETQYYLLVSDMDTAQVEKQLELEKQLKMEKTLIQCITTLESGLEIKDSINNLLEIVTRYFDGDRTYLFEIDYESQTTSNTYEWAAEGISREIDNLQCVPLRIIDSWLKIFREKGTFRISCLDKNVDRNSEEYAILQSQNIQSLIAVPLIKDGEIAGFFGVDNPKNNYHDLTLLSSMTYFIQNDLDKMRDKEQLERQSYEDILTGLYNRNRYNKDIALFETADVSNLGILYMDLNGLKQVNDAYGHEQGDILIKSTAFQIRRIFANCAYRIGGDEFVVIVKDVTKEEFHEKIRLVEKNMSDANINISVGTSWRSDNANITEQLREADRLMYRAKQEYYRKICCE